MNDVWNNKHFEAIRKIFPPAKPSVSEIEQYKKEIDKLKAKLNRNLDVLILGTTIEFIDFALKENMNITIVDYSKDYYRSVLKKEKFKNSNIRIFISKWEEMTFDNEFDVIIGDCIVGNVDKAKLQEFIKRVNKSLRNYGLFLGKNFLIPEAYQKKQLTDIIDEYYNKSLQYNPFTYMIFDLAIIYLDNNGINFKMMYDSLQNLLTQDTIKYFAGIKLLGETNCKFYIPTLNEYEKLINKYLNIKDIKYGTDIYSKNFPLYILEKRQSK